MKPRPNLLGQRFGRWQVLSQAHLTDDGMRWNCVCDCGTEKSVLCKHLMLGQSKSCGCLGRERQIARQTKHGASKSAEYKIWRSMRGRCNNPKHPSYHRYGGRGITVCSAWDKSFEQFLADMGKRPADKQSIDRIDNDKGYEPGNCRWATVVEQCNNTSVNRHIEVQGEVFTLAEAGRRFGIRPLTIAKRIRNGMSPDAAVLPREVSRA